MIKDENASTDLISMIQFMLKDKEKLHAIGKAASTLFVKDADQLIAREILNVLKSND